MKSFKISITLGLYLFTSIAMANIEGLKDEKLNSAAKVEITKQEIYDNVKRSFSIADEVVILEAGNNHSDYIPIDTKRSINDQLLYPEFARDERGSDVVVVSFTYTDDGFLKVLSLNSSDEELNPYIITKLENIRLKDGSVTIGKEYFARFQFKLI